MNCGLMKEKLYLLKSVEAEYLEKNRLYLKVVLFLKCRF